MAQSEETQPQMKATKSNPKGFKEEKKHGSQKRVALHEYSTATLGSWKYE